MDPWGLGNSLATYLPGLTQLGGYLNNLFSVGQVTLEEVNSSLREIVQSQLLDQNLVVNNVKGRG